MSRDLRLFNRQRTRSVDVGKLHKLVGSICDEFPEVGEFDLTIHLVDGAAMAELNERHLKHDGPTDVITLDYGGGGKSGEIAGEIFVCVEVAVEQARQYRTRWPQELVRYIIHGILHLGGHDDLKTPARRQMKREENRLLKRMAKAFPLGTLERK